MQVIKERNKYVPHLKKWSCAIDIITKRRKVLRKRIHLGYTNDPITAKKVLVEYKKSLVKPTEDIEREIVAVLEGFNSLRKSAIPV